MSTDTSLPRIKIAGELYCPHCSKRLFSWGDGFFSKCPHVIFAYFWGDPDMFFAVRPSYAKKFLHALLKSPAYHSFLAEEEMKSISEEDQRTFCNGTFSTENSVSSLIAEYCNDFPENLFPKLLPQSTVIFTDESDYSGVHIAIDPGGKTDEKKSRGAAYN